MESTVSMLPVQVSIGGVTHVPPALDEELSVFVIQKDTIGRARWPVQTRGVLYVSIIIDTHLSRMLQKMFRHNSINLYTCTLSKVTK